MSLEFVVLSARPESAPSLEYLRAWETFRDVWQETLQPIRGADYVQHSNDFTRQDKILALFDGGLCAGLDCLRRIDLRNPVDLDDSWLAAWPRDVLQELAARAPSAFINSYFTVHPSYRRTLAGEEHALSYALGSLSVLYQASVGMPLMIGMARHDRSMHTLVTRWGARSLLTTTYNQAETDLVVFEIEAVRIAVRAFPQSILELFESR